MKPKVCCPAALLLIFMMFPLCASSASAQSTAVYRINSGSTSPFTDSQGRVWAADSNFTGTSGIFTTTQAIAGTVDDALYQKERFGDFSYQLPIQNGSYTVVLHFAEIFFNSAGQRVFDVSLEGGLALDNLDIWSEAGQFNVLTKTLPVTVNDGTLNIGFTSVADFAKISAVEVLQGAVAPTWTTAAPIPTARYEAPSVAINGKIYVFGGFSNLNGTLLEATAQVHVYNPATNSWSALASIPNEPTGLTHHTLAVDNGKTVWLAGGFRGTDPGPAVANVWKYDIASDTWSAGPPLPAARAAGGLARIGRELHFISGVMADRNTDAAEHWVLNIDTGTSWTTAAPIPTPRNHFSTAVVNGKIYTVGGQLHHDSNTRDVATSEVYNPATNTWSTVAPMPRVRSHFEPGTFVRDGRIVAVGGGSNPGSNALAQISDFTEYDPTTNTWTELTPLPVPLRAPIAQFVGTSYVVAGGGVSNGFTPTTTTYKRTAASTNGSWSSLAALSPGRAEIGVAAAGGKVYTVGGVSGSTLLNAVSVYDPATNTWSTAAPVLGPPRDHIGVVAVDDKIYAIGGLTNWPGPSVADVYMYDPATNAWATRASLPVARGAMGVAVINGKIYAAGGLANSVAVNTLTVYDPQANTWTTLAPMPTVRDHLTAQAIEGKLYAIGGRDTQITAVTNKTEVYNPATNTWSTAANMLTARGSIASGVLNGRIYVFGADTGTSALATNDEYDPVTNSWRSVTPMITPRSSTGGAVIGGRIYAPGGKSASGAHNLTVNEVFVPGSGGGGPTNQPPVPDAGADQTITLPASASLSGSATDDGLPNPPGALTYTWSKFNGPGTVTFANANAASTTASFSVAGSYTLRLTASDSALSGFDDVVIVVNGGTSAPGPFQEQGGQVVMEAENFHAVINRSGKSWSAQTSPAGFAGASAMQALPNSGSLIETGYTTTSPELQYQVQFATAGTYHVWIRGFSASTADNSYHVGLDGQAVGSADRGTLNTLNSWGWTKATTDGPVATLVISSAGLHTINLWMREDGMYVDRLLLTTDGAFAPNGTGPAESPRSGTPANQPPVVKAGADQTITLPASASLSGSATDDGLPNPPATLTYTWSKFNGPGTVTFANANAASTTASFSVAGNYTLRLTVSDSAASGTDDVAINVTGGTGPLPFQEQGGQVVMEAEDFHAVINRGGKSWTAQTSPAGFAGASAMQALPNSGSLIDTGYTTTSPELQYQVQFATAGTYHVWIRGLAPSTADNAYHVGLNGQAVASADRGTLNTLNTWAWTKTTTDGPVATLVIPSAGLYTINLWMREDGIYVDRLLLTTNSTFVPSGTGPAESPR